ncbi:Trp family transcriptional regulator [Moraxella nasovis]|uniref:Trp family transcriptional regulator n=1 Tax=Moraxella nasovis TaxID=2904121 RepID=UPI001F6031FA|nr:Trp family transcriptional regulator [Moraxella nasovis]UNU74177.1 Trp family transcriptional regulator [Moraxella nasovis]
MYHYTRTQKQAMPKSAHQSAHVYLVQLLCENQDPQYIESLLSAILTQKEQAELANRILIFALLQQGLPQREIAERLGVGIATVSRGAKAYQVNDVASLLPNLKERF